MELYCHFPLEQCLIEHVGNLTCTSVQNTATVKYAYDRAPRDIRSNAFQPHFCLTQELPTQTKITQNMCKPISDHNHTFDMQATYRCLSLKSMQWFYKEMQLCSTLTDYTKYTMWTKNIDKLLATPKPTSRWCCAQWVIKFFMSEQFILFSVVLLLWR